MAFCMYNVKHMFMINFKHPQVFKTPNLPFHSDNLREIHYEHFQKHIIFSFIFTLFL